MADYDVYTIIHDDFWSYPFFNEEYDTIVINASCSHEERKVFQRLADFVKHDNLIEGSFWWYDINSLLDESMEIIFQEGDNDTDSLSDNLERNNKVNGIISKIQRENENVLSYHFVPKGFEEDFVKDLRLDETAPSAIFFKECNDKKVLFLETSAYQNDGDISYESMDFMRLYNPSMIKFIKLSVKHGSK